MKRWRTIISSSDGKIKKIGILHLNQIGDLFFALPVIANLRHNFPQAEIHSIIKPYLAPLLDGLVDRVIPRKDGNRDKLALLKNLRAERYDLLISLPRSEECLLLTACSGAATRAGFKRRGLDLALNHKVTIKGHNCWHNNRRLLKKIGIPIIKDDYVGLLRATEDISGLDLPQRFAVVSPGASLRRQAKTWDNLNFARLTARLYSEMSLTILLVGSRENAAANQLIATESRKLCPEIPIRDFSGNLALTPLASVLRRAALFVGIDSGIMHMASSLDVPTVGLFGPTDPYYVGPQNHKSKVVRMDEMECMPCYLKPCDHLDCMRNLPVEKVFEACLELGGS